MNAVVLASPQQINLYNESLLPPRHQFSSHQLAAWVGIALVALAAVAWWATDQMRALRQEMAQQAALRPAKVDDGPSPQQLAALEQGLRAKLAVLQTRRAARDVLKRGMAGPDAGPSFVLRRIAETIPPSAWLTGLTVSASHIDIRARALDPAAVDLWLDRLRSSGFLAREPAPALRLDRIEPAAGKTLDSYGFQVSATLAAPFADE